MFECDRLGCVGDVGEGRRGGTWDGGMDEGCLGPYRWCSRTGGCWGLGNVGSGGLQLVVLRFELHVLFLHLVKTGGEGGHS